MSLSFESLCDAARTARLDHAVHETPETEAAYRRAVRDLDAYLRRPEKMEAA